MNFLDLLFPKRCVSCGKFGGYICKDCFSKIEFVDKPVCPLCQRQAVGGKTHPGCLRPWGLDGLVVVCRYRGPVKRAIAKVKYKWIYDMEEVFVKLLGDNLWKFNLPAGLTMVPVPLHQKRRRWRGFNQAEILAVSLAKRFGVPFADNMRRIIETATQVGLKREDRRKNVRGAFALKSNGSVQGKNILLVDDVYTSGATMAQCAKVLKRAGAREVWGLAVALG